jgi:hypothetical protein
VLPNDMHPGPGCSCPDCLSLHPDAEPVLSEWDEDEDIGDELERSRSDCDRAPEARNPDCPVHGANEEYGVNSEGPR